MKQVCREYILGLEGATAADMAAGSPEPWVIKNVKLLGVISQKGRRYTSQALEGAVTLYEGKPIYEDHVEEDKSLPPGSFHSRGVRESLGFVRNVRHMPGQGLFGDACFTVKDKLTESVMIAAGPKGNPAQYGFSPHHYYDGNKAADGFFDVTVINHVESIDLVTKPATTGGLFEGVTVVPTDTSKLSVAGNGKTPAKKRTARQALEGLCRVNWERKTVAALEGYADVPVADTMAKESDAQPSAEEQMNAAFEAMVLGIMRDTSLDFAGKKNKLSECLKAQDKLMNGGESKEGETSPDGTPKVEGETPAGTKEDEKDKSKEGVTVVAKQEGIGATEAVKLFSKYKLPVNADALEGIQTLAAPVAEFHVKRMADDAAKLAERDDQIAKLKGLLPDPKSIPRGAWMGLEGKTTVTKPNERKVPTWASVN